MEFYVVASEGSVVHKDLFIDIDDARAFRDKANKAGATKYGLRKVIVYNKAGKAVEDLKKASTDFTKSIQGIVDELFGRDS